jgi:hypothetical protein
MNSIRTGFTRAALDYFLSEYDTGGRSKLVAHLGRYLGKRGIVREASTCGRVDADQSAFGVRGSTLPEAPYELTY